MTQIFPFLILATTRVPHPFFRKTIVAPEVARAGKSCCTESDSAVMLEECGGEQLLVSQGGHWSELSQLGVGLSTKLHCSFSLRRKNRRIRHFSPVSLCAAFLFCDLLSCCFWLRAERLWKKIWAKLDLSSFKLGEWVLCPSNNTMTNTWHLGPSQTHLEICSVNRL